MTSFYDFTARLGTGAEQRLDAYRGRVVLIVNVASQCGFTPQYEGLQALQSQYGPRGFDVLAFPSNQFGRQEPGTDAAIATFCDTRYRVTFPVFSKTDVNGAGASPLWVWLKSQKGGLLGSAIKWNFTKFLVDPAGQVAGRYPPTTAPGALAPDIERLLPA